MARKTKKYLGACALLNMPPNADIPHAALYGMLALRGYTWDGKQWVVGETMRVYNGSVRVSVVPGHVDEFTTALTNFLLASGCEVHKISQPYKSEKGDQSRVYINFTYEG